MNDQLERISQAAMIEASKARAWAIVHPRTALEILVGIGLFCLGKFW